MNRKTLAILSVVLAGLLMWAASSESRSLAQGAVGPLQYQGRLTDPTTGDPVADGGYAMTFKLYNVASGGSALWTETKSVSVQGGLFSTALGDTTPLSQNLFDGQALWLGVKVGADAETTPRQQILPVAYALYAYSVWSLSGNAGTTPGTHFLGTTDNQALELWVNNARALRLEPKATSPNVIGGYSGNSVTGGVNGATIGGGGSSGYINLVTANYATIGGGRSNTASAESATIGGGFDNEASWAATVGGGIYNTAYGLYATVPGGRNNTAWGNYSFAAGRRAIANNQGCFVWGDSTDADVTCDADDRFIVRASGGVYLYSSGITNTGVYLPANSSSWSSLSDRNFKENLVPMDTQEVLARLAEIPVTTWNYKTQNPSIRHAGPMAQDFYAAFGLGEDDQHISTVDADGVALAAIQGLYHKVQAQETRLEMLEAENAALRGRLDSLEAQVAALKRCPEPRPEPRPEPVEGPVEETAAAH